MLPSRMKNVNVLPKLLGFMMSVSLLTVAQDAKPGNEQLKPVLSAINEAIANDYYDKQAATERWPAIQSRYRAKIEDAGTKQEALRLIRKMLTELHNSHFLFYSPAGFSRRA